MTEIEQALVHYDGDNSKPYCDLVYKALKTLQNVEKRLTSINNAQDSDLINARLNLDHLDKLTSDIPAIKHCFERIRDVVNGGGLDRARPISVEALKSYVNLGIKFCDEVML